MGSDVIVDYKSPEANSKLRALGGYDDRKQETKFISSFKHFLFSFDVILDCTGKWDGFDYDLLKPCANAKYLTLVPPILNNFNNYGVIGGILKTIYDLIAANALIIFQLKTLRWVLFSPNSSALRKLRDYAQNDQVFTLFLICHFVRHFTFQLSFLVINESMCLLLAQAIDR